MKLKFLFYLTISINILFSLNNCWAQTELFTGRLIDFETKKPIANAKISIIDKEFSTYSNALGYFQASGVNKVIKVTHVGYKTVTTELKAGTPNFLLAVPPNRYLLQVLQLEELVEVNAQHKTSLSPEEEIENRSVNNPQADLLASFPGGLKEFHVYLINSMYKNRDSLDSPIDLNILFTINKSGELKVDSMQGEIQSQGIIGSIFENSPKWVPALQNELAVSTSFQQGLLYQPATKVEQQAEPNGGVQSFYDYVSTQINIKNYPLQAKRMGIEGIVYVQFVIETDGSPTNVVIV